MILTSQVEVHLRDGSLWYTTEFSIEVGHKNGVPSLFSTFFNPVGDMVKHIPVSSITTIRWVA